MQYPLINQWRTYPAPHKSFNKNEKVSQRKMNRNKFKPKIPILYSYQTLKVVYTPNFFQKLLFLFET